MTAILEQLKQYRSAREQTLGIQSTLNPAGEACGRTYIPIQNRLRQSIPNPPVAPDSFVQALEQVLLASPIEIRPNEPIIGDYYYLLPADLILQLPILEGVGYSVMQASGHTAVNVSHGLRMGWGGIAKHIEQTVKQKSIQQDSEKTQYLQAMLKLVQLIQQHIQRYIDQAKALMHASKADEDMTLYKNYMRITKDLEWLKHKPPRTFLQALQWYWLYVTFERVTSIGMGACRLDQVFLPYYKQDIAKNTLSKEQALTYIQALFLKEGLFYCIGGVDEFGRDAVNELSFLALQAYDSIGGPSNLSVRWHPEINRDFIVYALDILSRHKSGVPNLVNDPVIISSLEYYGFSESQARDYTFSGCFWWVVPGKEFPSHDIQALYATDILQYTLNQCYLDPPQNFNDFMAQFVKNQEATLHAFLMDLNQMEKAAAQYYPEMVISLLMDSCIDSGLDVTNNGTDFSMTTVLYVGFATVVDSMYTIQQLLYEEQAYTWKDLEELLHTNFASDPSFKKRIDSLPKYGMNHHDVDSLANQVKKSIEHQVGSIKTGKGFRLRPAFYSWNRHIAVGKRLGATPDGRSAGLPVSQGMNPSPGCCKNGITAAINSFGTMDYTITAGAPMHLHLTPEGNTANQQHILQALVTTAFQKGIPQLIINYLDKNMLEQAQLHPEKHWDVTVRVTGYSARFVQIGRAIQDEIIGRQTF